MEHIFKQPTPQQIDAVKIVYNLWDQEDIKTQIAPFNYFLSYHYLEDPGQWKELKYELKTEMVENIKGKVSALEISESLKENAVSLIKPLGLEIWKWWFYHNVANKNFILNMPNKLCWTPQGTINYKTTAQLIVKDENEDIETRYKMACVYCFVDQISTLWKRIPEERKKVFYDFEKKYVGPCWVLANEGYFLKDLVLFWTHVINDKMTELNKLLRQRYSHDISPDLYAFKCATFGLNQTATEFFFEILSRAREEVDPVYHVTMVLFCSLYHGRKLEYIFSMLNQMSAEQQRTVYERRTFYILECMLDWPYQTLFLETAQKWFHYLMNDDCPRLFNAICAKIKRGEKDYNYEELLRQFWQLAAVNDKNFFRKDYALLSVADLYEAKIEDLMTYVVNPTIDYPKERSLYIKTDDCDYYDYRYYPGPLVGKLRL